MIRKIDIIAVVSIIFLLLVSYTSFFNRERVKMTALKVKEEKLKNKLKLAEEVNIGLETIKEETTHIRKKLKEFEKRLPGKEDIPAFLKNINKIAEYNKVKLMSIIPNKPEKGSIYSKIPVNITVEARFKNLYKFLYQIENANRVIRIEEITINKPSLTGIMKTKMHLSIFAAI